MYSKALYVNIYNRLRKAGTDMNINKIWKIKEHDDLVIALDEYISEKCEYGEEIDNLSYPERIFFITQAVEMEVNNGGFNQFFVNSSSDFAEEMVKAFEEIGAIHTAKICKKAIKALGRELPPVGSDEREEVLGELVESDEINDILEECDDAFYEYEDDLEELNYAYVMKNKDYFV